MANKIESTETFVDSKEARHSYRVEFYNLNNKFYITLPNGKNIYIDKESTIKLGSFGQGSTLIVSIYASSKTNCEGELLSKKYIELKKLNEYSKRAECKDRRDLNVCAEWEDTSDVTEEEFLKLVKQENKVEEAENRYLNFFVDNWYVLVISGCVIFVAMFLIIKITNKRKNKIEL